LLRPSSPALRFYHNPWQPTARLKTGRQSGDRIGFVLSKDSMPENRLGHAEKPHETSD
jgi:hypothetical protein